jgi:hypothetical protein
MFTFTIQPFFNRSQLDISRPLNDHNHRGINERSTCHNFKPAC